MPYLAENRFLLAGVLSALSLLAGVFLMGAPFWAALLVAVCLFGGVSLVGSSALDAEIAKAARKLGPESMRAKIREGRAKVAELTDVARTMADTAARERVLRVAAMAERIFDNFEEDPADAAKAGRFLLYLDRFLPLVARYARLSATPEGRELLKERSDDEEFYKLLEVAEESFAQGYKNYLENDVVEMRTFGRVLRKMMDVAEVGR